jgi:hypothetical protein
MINTKKAALGSWVSPRAEINGHPVPLRWGDNYIPAPPGVHHIRIHMPWAWRYGKAEITVDNTSAAAPPVYYAMPFTTMTRGAIGLQPMKNPGLLALILTLVLPFMLIAACCVGVYLLDN